MEPETREKLQRYAERGKRASCEQALSIFGDFIVLEEKETKDLATFARLRIPAHEYLDILYARKWVVRLGNRIQINFIFRSGLFDLSH